MRPSTGEGGADALRPDEDMTFDLETLAAYIDQRLSPAQRAAVEAHLKEDPVSCAILMESLTTVEAMASGHLAETASSDSRMRLVWRRVVDSLRRLR